MEDIKLLETIDRYLAGEMSAEEHDLFETIRKNTPSIDQMVKEHEMFLLQMDQYAAKRNFAKLTEKTFQHLLAAGEWTLDNVVPSKVKIIQLWNKYKKVTAIAASVGGLIALTTSAFIPVSATTRFTNSSACLHFAQPGPYTVIFIFSPLFYYLR